ncbi:hypothetical protein [Solirubrobacter soli]|uniref:hypothetical protein n=1 Tax=Solirubrobacter soli TaxID=363832 RepID=UPI0004290478|nr:hypothetical protein [Solirubrobacter soli]
MRIALIAIASLAMIRLSSTLTIIGLFAAALLALDRLSPASSAADAQEHFERLVRRRRRRRRRSAPLEVLDLSPGWTTRAVGVQAIELDAIAGTVEPAKARQFDREFRPDRSAAARWKPLWLAYRRGDPVPPVTVYRVDGRYWLSDGHHRVSALRDLGVTTVDGDVVELVRSPRFQRARSS